MLHAAEIEQSHDVWILNIIDKWHLYYYQNEDILFTITNFIASRLIEYNPAARVRAIQVLRKVLKARTKLAKLESTEVAFDNPTADEILPLTRYVPQAPRPYFDDANDGWNEPLTKYKQYEPGSPFGKSDEQRRSQELLYSKLVSDDKQFVTAFVGTLLHDLGVKADSQILHNDSSKVMYKTTIK